MRDTKKQRRELEKQLTEASSYKHWLATATNLDELEGTLAWREEDGCELLHEALIRDHITAMKRCRDQGDTRALTRVLQESLYRHLGEIGNPDLYAIAWSGTKVLVSEFLDEVERSMNFLCDNPMPGVSDQQKLRLFRDAERVYGRPALMLSGGAAFGIYHIGVTRALWQEGLLPDVIAGSSMGAIVAGAICTRNNRELERFFNEPGEIHLDAFRWLEPKRIWRKRHAMDQFQLLHHIRTNIGRTSFQEAAERSGRTLNISVSPTRTRQKPRLLNNLASPEVLVDSAILASCAVPGIYPPVTLQARDKDRGDNGGKPYMPTERWIDGSVHGDLPLMRMARLHNVNRTIVSQANPHVLPFISHHHQRGPGASAKQAAASLMHAQVATTLQLTRNSWSSTVLRPLLEQAHAMATQTYLGDINIQFPFKPLLYRKILSNPNKEDLEMFIRLGEQATWPRMAMIRDQTRISRTFSDCITRLEKACAANDNAAE
ncbi:patatin-like phospholipase family protein [Marinobacter salarius]|uniref:patatin-like phospholipase family protein n=1 Tax=Marinobacter salarius TaxID=1420917 RepID=UPI00273B201B|nr:patatin-like phospholipase family protein [Marinobacter salarius]MDP4533691.1 patatin-like phospholipase family protein [Marinobacter salarius]